MAEKAKKPLKKPARVVESTKSKIPSVREMLEAGVQFGHRTKRWNPRMEPYIYTVRGGIHIIDIVKTGELLKKALEFLTSSAEKGEVLFVGTKRQAAEIVEKEAIRCGAHFVVNRWPGGLLTNFPVVKKGLERLVELETKLQEGIEDRTKQEISWLKREWERLDRLYGGVKTLAKKPVVAIIIDPKHERNAVRECRRVGVPIVALIDTNADPTSIDYPVPGNDDALKSVTMFIKLFAEAVLEGNKGRGVEHKRIDMSGLEIKRAREKTEGKLKKTETGEMETDGEQMKPDEERKKTEEERHGKKREETEKRGKIAETITESTEGKEKKIVKKTKEAKVVVKDEEKKLSARTLSALEKNKVKIEDLGKMSDEEILKLKGVGKKALEEIRTRIKTDGN